VKSDSDIEREVARIDDNINNTRAAMDVTDRTITSLLKLQAGRRDYLRKLGASRSELQTYELNFEVKA
jgi:hypothetical protein